jgi:hypothetical protein
MYRPMAIKTLLFFAAIPFTLGGCPEDDGNQDMSAYDMRKRPDLPAPGPGRTCAQAIDLTNETLPYSSSTANGISDTGAQCDPGGDLAPEIYFTYEAGTTPVDLLVDVAVDPSTPFDALVTARSDCQDQSTELFCADLSGSQHLEVLGASGTVTLVVDGTDSYMGDVEGDFTINVRKRPILALGDDCDVMGVNNRCGENTACRAGKCVASSADIECAAAVDLTTALQSGSTTVTGFVLPFETGFFLGSCAYSQFIGWPERIYKITVTTPVMLDANTDDDTGTDFDTVLYVTQGTCDGTEVQCHDDVDVNNGEYRSHLTTPLQPGTYYLIVDVSSASIYGAFDREPRNFKMTVALSSAATDL